MFFKDLSYHQTLVNEKKKEISLNSTPHAQLFYGESGNAILSFVISYINELFVNQLTDNERIIKNCNKLIHPDLHIIFPTPPLSESINKSDVNFNEKWRALFLTNSFMSFEDWFMSFENTKGKFSIQVNEIKSIFNFTLTQPIESKYKIILIWGIDKMNVVSQNKLLKLLEEPPDNVMFMLIAEETNYILPTVLSRCQLTYIPKLTLDEVSSILSEKLDISSQEAFGIALKTNLDISKSIRVFTAINESDEGELFSQLVRLCFSAKSNPSALTDLYNLSEEIAKKSKDQIKNFLLFSIEFFRQALMYSYKADELAILKDSNVLNFNSFSKFIHSANCESIINNLNKTIAELNQNATPIHTFFNSFISISRDFHKIERP